MRTRARWKNVPNRGQNMTFVDTDHSPAAGKSIWEACPQLAMLDPSVGFSFMEDFLSFPIDDTTANPTAWKLAGDTATGAVTTPAGILGGVINVATGALDNNETYIQLGTATFEPFCITNASGKPVYFEARVKSLQHADEAIFVGLAEAGCAAADFLADNTGVPADKDYIGFRYKTDAPTEWDFAYKKAGQAEQEAAAVAVNADDWHTFSFYFDGASTIYVYIDGVLQATTHATSGATFPSGEEMSPIIAIKTGAAAARNVQVDWIKVAQLR